MIVTKQKPIDDILKCLDKVERIFIVGCAQCATVCKTGGEEDIKKIKELLDRVKKERFREIIIATDFNAEGEATALYLFKVLKNSGARLTRVAYGIPVGGDLQYADQATIIKAFEGRREIG